MSGLNQSEMIEMAKQAGWQYAHGESGYEPLWAFAKLVAQHEREACAKIGDDHPSWSSRMYSATIRARNET
jgi:hypothetical protein